MHGTDSGLPLEKIIIFITTFYFFILLDGEDVWRHCVWWRGWSMAKFLDGHRELIIYLIDLNGEWWWAPSI